MGKEYSVQEALKLAIKAEKDSMDFYLRAAASAKNERARKVLEMLAAEEASHVKHFFDHYKGTEFGDLQSFMTSPVDTKNPTYMQLEKSIDAEMGEKVAMELALAEEKTCIGQYTQLAAGVVDPVVKAIFERVVKETENHYALIEAEYAHLMGMVGDSDVDTFVRE